MKRFVTAVTLLGLVGLGAGSVRAEMVQIKGSDTLINMVQRLAEEYMNKNPGKMISVTGGGSGTGIAGLINKKCDIGNASRLMSSKEIKMAADRGVDAKRIIVAVDGLSIIVNKNNEVSQLTMDQVGKIFRGEIKNWSELGGSNMAINLYGRQSNSGTYQLMQEMVLKGDYSSKMRQMNGNAQIVESVKQDAGAIGYVGVGYVKNEPNVNVLLVSPYAGAKFANPLNEGEVASGEYPIARPLNQYVNGTPSGDVLDFIKYELSAEGQRVVADEGFFVISAEYQKLNKAVLGK